MARRATEARGHGGAPYHAPVRVALESQEGSLGSRAWVLSSSSTARRRRPSVRSRRNRRRSRRQARAECPREMRPARKRVRVRRVRAVSQGFRLRCSRGGAAGRAFFFGAGRRRFATAARTSGRGGEVGGFFFDDFVPAAYLVALDATPFMRARAVLMAKGSARDVPEA
jgi:hypothetical protein